MTHLSFVLCDSCGHEICRDSLHVYYYQGEEWFFHRNNTCFPAWERQRKLDEANRLLADEIMR